MAVVFTAENLLEAARVRKGLPKVTVPPGCLLDFDGELVQFLADSGRATEDPAERTRILRKLLVYGSYLQNHATHLYLFAAPDYVGAPSVLPLAKTHPDVVARALKIKKLGNELCNLVGGRSVHPVTTVVGGFTSEPDPRRLEAFRDMLLEVADDVLATVDLFASLPVPDLATAGEMLALSAADDYAIKYAIPRVDTWIRTECLPEDLASAFSLDPDAVRQALDWKNRSEIRYVKPLSFWFTGKEVASLYAASASMASPCAR